MPNASMDELRRYVTAKDGVSRFGPGTLALTISHSNLRQRWIEIRFDLDDTIANVKNKLYKHGGTPPEFQKLQLLDSSGQMLGELSNDNLTLRDYRVQNNFELRIVDLDSNSLAKSGWLEDTSLVEKYVMPDEVYAAREGTVRKFKEQQLLLKEQEQKKNPVDTTNPSDVDENMTVGKRCEIFPGGRRGEIKYVGDAPNLGEGIWIGVALDEPLGKNDGTVKGKRYFTCIVNHGVMVRPSNVTVGDFPIRGLSDVESDDEI